LLRIRHKKDHVDSNWHLASSALIENIEHFLDVSADIKTNVATPKQCFGITVFNMDGGTSARDLRIMHGLHEKLILRAPPSSSCMVPVRCSF